MNSLIGHSFKSIKQNCVIPGSMDQVRFAGTMGRSNLVGRSIKIHFKTHESGSGSLAGWLYPGNWRKGKGD